MEEYVYVYNSDGQRSNRTVLREVANDNNFWRHACSVAILNSKGEILLQKRADRKSNPNEWELCSGHVTAGEGGASKSIDREIKEELGITRKRKLELLKRGFKTNEERNHFFIDIFSFTQNIDITQFNIDTNEISEIKWADVKSIKELSLGQYKLGDEELDVILKLIQKQIEKNQEER